MKKAGSAMKVNDLGRAPQTEVILEKMVPVYVYKALEVFIGGVFSR